METMEPNVPTNVTRKDILMKLLYSILSIVISIQIIINYSFFIMRVTPAKLRDKHFNDIMNYISTIVILFNVFLIFYNTRLNHKFRNLRIRSKIDKPAILYIICLPLVTLSFLGLIIIFIDISLRHEKEIAMYCVAVTVEFFALIVLLLDISGFRDTGEEWFMNWFNVLTISVTMISLVMQVIYNVIIKETGIFTRYYFKHLNNISVFANIYPHSYTKIFDEKVFEWITDCKKTCIIMLFTVFIPYQMIPLKRNLRHMLRYLEERIESDYILRTREESFFSRFGVITAGVFIVMSAGSNVCQIMIQYVRTEFDIVIITSVKTPVYIIGNLFLIFLKIIMIKEVNLWPRTTTEEHSKFKTVLVYVGTCGQCTAILNNLLIDTYKVITGQAGKISYIYITNNLLSFFGIMLTSSLITMFLERKSRSFIKGSWNFIFCTPLVMLVVNFNIIIYEIILVSNFEEDHGFQIETAIRGIVAFSKPLVYLYRIMIVFILGSTITSMINQHSRIYPSTIDR